MFQIPEIKKSGCLSKELCLKHQSCVAGVSGKKLKMALLIRLDAWSQQVQENQRNVSTALHSGDTGATNTKGSCEAYTLKIKDEVAAGTDLKDIA